VRGSNSHPVLRPRPLNSYAAYSIGCGIAWAIVWALVLALDPKHTIDKVVWVFLGWLIGWTSATIARLVYPPPKRRRSAGPTSFFQGFRET
jgi:hypothetical protein